MKSLFIVFVIVMFLCASAAAQTTSFTYQGSLKDGASPANGSFQMQFKLFDAAAAGAQIGSTVSDVPVTANQGIFTATLDFGSNALSGANRWLEIAVRHNSGESYTTLSPREQIASSPYSVRTLSAASAENAANLGGLPANRYVSTDAGGNVGLGTAAPAAKLDVRGSMVLDPGISPSFYTAASGGEQNRYLNLLNSPTLASASGLKAGGVLVADSFAFANPGKNDLIVKGSVGIGTATPTSKVEIAAQDGLRITGFQPFLTLRDGSSNAFLQNVGGNLTVIDANLAQNPAASGLLKFGLLINADGSINLCFNTLSPSVCGVSVSHPQTGYYDITFPYQINSRIFSVTLALPPSFQQQNIDVVMARPTNQQTLRVRASTFGPAVVDADTAFYLTVF